MLITSCPDVRLCASPLSITVGEGRPSAVAKSGARAARLGRPPLGHKAEALFSQLLRSSRCLNGHARSGTARCMCWLGVAGAARPCVA
jgi:hypothetical protein